MPSARASAFTDGIICEAAQLTSIAELSVTMAMYFFRIWRPGSDASDLVTRELAHDSQSYAVAGELLSEHPASEHVDVWCGERPVLSRHRTAPRLKAVSRRASESSWRPEEG